MFGKLQLARQLFGFKMLPGIFIRRKAGGLYPAVSTTLY